MKPVLISIQRPHTDNIKALIKKIEIRKNKPNQETPFPCYIYETKSKGGCGKVIGEFVCDKITSYTEKDLFYGMDEISNSDVENESCVDIDSLLAYKGEKKYIYGWHISDLKIYDKPKELGEFIKYMDCKNTYDCCACHNWSRLDLKCIAMNNEVKRPPQSWCYVEAFEEVK